MTVRIGIDLGGSNLRGAAFESAERTETLQAPIGWNQPPRWSHRESVGTDRDPETMVERVATVVERLASDDRNQIAVGVGIAAMMRDRRGTVARSPHLGPRWDGVPFGELLAKRLNSGQAGSRFRLGVYNDVNAITWGEYVAGAARGCRNVLAVYVGTGIGGGIIADHQLLEGSSHCAGEIGHTKVRWDEAAEPCACGGRGCVEAYVGGSYLDRRIARELGGNAGRGRRKHAAAVQIAGRIEDVTVAHVDRAAAEGDEWALGLWTEVGTLLAVSLGNALAVLNSERLVLGGGLLTHTPTLQGLVETAVMLVAPAPILDGLEIVSAELGDNAGLVGAAALAASGTSLVDL